MKKLKVTIEINIAVIKCKQNNTVVKNPAEKDAWPIIIIIIIIAHFIYKKKHFVLYSICK